MDSLLSIIPWDPFVGEQSRATHIAHIREVKDFVYNSDRGLEGSTIDKPLCSLCREFEAMPRYLRVFL